MHEPVTIPASWRKVHLAVEISRMLEKSSSQPRCSSQVVAGPLVILALAGGQLVVNGSDLELSWVWCGKPGKKGRDLSCPGDSLSCGGSALRGVLNVLKVLCPATLHRFDHCVIESR